ncbi:cation transporter [Salinisphaera aquimarina]|uniref:Cation transporter n=1 Tax=Salinisphaera aquimarina TaxID=2094031 RepID=A0ABV7EVC6_9GAMM
MSDCGCEFEAKDQTQRQALYWLLGINGVMFLTEFGVGMLGGSTALIADSLDNFADAAVYSAGLYAVGRAAHHKARAASIGGVVQILLALFALSEVVRRTVMGSNPESAYMILMGLAALAANTVCLLIIARHRDGGVHMRASWIFSANDVIANVGVIIGGTLVYYLDTRIPDLIIGLIVGLIVLLGGVQILRDARRTTAEMPSSAAP